MQQQEVLWRLEDQVNPGHTALLVIDPQNDFCANDGALIRIMGWDPSRIQRSVPRLNRFIQRSREAQLMVVWTKSLIDPVRSKPSFKARGFMQEAKAKLIEPVKAATDGSEWYSEVLKPLDNEYVITKYHYDAFADTDLDLLLRGRGIKTLLLTGYTTNVCVETAARDGYLKGYYIVAVSDCTEAPTKQEYEASIFNMGTYFGKAATSDEIAKIW